MDDFPLEAAQNALPQPPVAGSVSLEHLLLLGWGGSHIAGVRRSSLRRSPPPPFGNKAFETAECRLPVGRSGAQCGKMPCRFEAGWLLVCKSASCPAHGSRPSRSADEGRRYRARLPRPDDRNASSNRAGRSYRAHADGRSPALLGLRAFLGRRHGHAEAPSGKACGRENEIRVCNRQMRLLLYLISETNISQSPRSK